MVNPLSFPSGKVNITQQTVVISNHSMHIATHPDGSSTAFTPPATSTIETFTSQNLQLHSVQHQPHITPLMEVDLTGKWSEKDFVGFPSSMSLRSNYSKSYKSGPKHGNGPYSCH